MAIQQGRLSTQVVEDTFVIPDGYSFYANVSWERGPIAIEDTTEGLLYQNWMLYWNPTTGDVTVKPDNAAAIFLMNLSDIRYITFTFDQNGRISLSYSTGTSSYLYWYDSALAMTVTTDLGSDVITPSLHLDDKRQTQNAVNDMLLWYTKADGGGTYTLYELLQRERFLTEHVMGTTTKPYLYNIGLHVGLRVQLIFRDRPPQII